LATWPSLLHGLLPWMNEVAISYFVRGTEVGCKPLGFPSRGLMGYFGVFGAFYPFTRAFLQLARRFFQNMAFSLRCRFNRYWIILLGGHEVYDDRGPN
jgi:hypothetical protein